MKRHILIAGCGNFGSWWAASCSLLGTQVEITVFDPYKNNISLIEERFSELNKNNSEMSNLNYINKLEDIKGNIDICVVACNSSERPKLIYELSLLINPFYWIIEKVIACTPQLLKEISEILKNKRVLVSHSRRMQPLWQMAKIEIKNNYQITEINQHIGKWELLSNSFHFADIISWCFDTCISKVVTNELKNWRESKVREGYSEAEGRVSIIYKNNIRHNIITTTKPENNFSFFENVIPDKKVLYLKVDEIKGILTKSNKVICTCKLYNWSNLGHYFISELLKDNILLPSLNEVYINHYKLIDSYNLKWKEDSNYNKNIKIS